MIEQAMSQRRTGGREARHALRQAPTPADRAPIRPGLPGGQLRVLSEHDVERVHQTSLDILERIGVGDPKDSWRELVLEHGGRMSETGRLCFPHAMVEDAIAKAGRDFVLRGRDPAHDLDLSGTRVHCGGGSGTVWFLDPRTGEFREPKLVDLYDIVRLEDTLENMHFVIRPCVARDMLERRDLDINTAYACMSGTTKHIVTSFMVPENVDLAVAMYDMSLGGDGSGEAFRKRPFAQVICAIVSPLRLNQELCGVIETAVRNGMPLTVASASQTGATSPAALAGGLAQGNAEILATLTVINLLAPGHPLLYGNWPFVSDLRTGAFAGGGGEMAVLAAASAQMANFYDVPSGIGSGMSSSKQPDAQSGWEKGYLTALPALSGTNLIYESAGILADVLGFSLEALVIDADMIGGVLRALRGIEVSDETLSLDVIAEVVEGPGYFLGHPQTLALMETEYVYPSLADRRTIDDWKESGATDIRQRAGVHLREVLSRHYPSHVAPGDDARIRERLDIRLAPEEMRPGNERW